MFTYSQISGALTHDGKPVGSGYSGRDDGRDNPAMQSVPNAGPIPQGVYEIGTARTHPHLGPCVMALTPRAGTETFGRYGFFIHGDSANHDASHGCIVVGQTIRNLIASSGDRLLTVIP